MNGTSRRLTAVLLGLGCLVGPAWAAEGDATPPAETTYVVKAGDTLWTIARDVLKDPSRWRRLWERNPFITHPDRIFPGDTLALPSAHPPAPPIAQAPPAPDSPVQAPAAAEAAVQAPAVETPPAETPSPPAAPSAIQAAPVPPVPAASPHALACSPLLAPEGTPGGGLGHVLKGEEDRLLLSQEDAVFVGLAGDAPVAPGDRLAVVRAGERLAHPVTRRPLGHILSTLGVLEVQEVRDRVAKARIAYSCDSVQAGDLVTRLAVTPLPEQPATAPASRSVEGVVVASPRAEDLLGLQQLVFLDVGAGQGIQVGDVFAIYRPHVPAVNPAGGAPFPMPPERLGEAVVLRLTPGTATAVLTASRKESHAGDRVVLSRQRQP